ncbi:MAG: ligase-associated DNA damage response endonuclease PdeM [Rhodomicrobium sp.]
MTTQRIDAPPARALGSGKAAAKIEFAGLALTLDNSGAAFINSEATLLVADLHLEKASRSAAQGRLLPALDSCDTLHRLKRAIEAYNPWRVICLGDSFDDRFAGERMAEADREELAFICAQAGEWIWLTGNHDPEIPAFCGGETVAEIAIGGVILCHAPAANRAAPQIVGHIHPKASVPAGGSRFSGPCFCVSHDLLIMPAFGAYAGGVSCLTPAIRSLHRSEPKVYMLHAKKIWRVA